MSSIVSRRPSLRNQPNEAFWMSIRWGRSRTCFRRENDLRARGAATVAVKRYSLPLRRNENQKIWTGEDGGTSAQPLRVPKDRPPPQERPCGARVLRRIVANGSRKGKKAPRERPFADLPCCLSMPLVLVALRLVLPDLELAQSSRRRRTRPPDACLD